VWFIMGGVDKKDKLVQMCLVERERMNKWCFKLEGYWMPQFRIL
jgi:hypothetical protein